MKVAAADIGRDIVRLGDGAAGLARAALILGGVGLAAALAMAPFGAESFFRGYVTNLAYFASLALGGLFFVLIQHLTRAGWSVVVRRIAENFTAALPVLAALAAVVVIPVTLGFPAAIHHVYHWTDAEHVAHDPILLGKAGYLNGPFFLLRMALYFAIWTLMARYFHRASVLQDDTGDPDLTSRMQGRSPVCVIIYALTVTFFSFDLLMSLNPHWFSTIFGVYYFSGAAMGSFALMAITMYLYQRNGRLERTISREHYHDVGKLVFAFTVFWAYIAFSQYMLIWYANIPEETTWYLIRQQGPWLTVSLILLFGHFVVPLLLLISRWPKRHPNILVGLCGWLLLMHWFDMMYLAMPHEMAGQPGVPAPLKALDVLQCVASFVGVGGLCAWAVVGSMRRAALAPLKDPRLNESLAFHNI